MRRKPDLLCFICEKLIPTNAKKDRLGTSSLWGLYEKFQSQKGFTVSEEDKQQYCCRPCNGKVSIDFSIFMNNNIFFMNLFLKLYFPDS